MERDAVTSEDQRAAEGGARRGIRARLLNQLARARGFRNLVPESLKRLGRRFLPREAYQRALWRAAAAASPVEAVSSYPARVDVTLGIIRDLTGGRDLTGARDLRVAACRDMGVPYRLVDISGPDWIDVVRHCGCDAFLVYPKVFTAGWRLMYDERLKIMADDLGLVLCPSFHDELWIFESKRRMHYWLTLHDVPHPRTWVFYSYDGAMAFAETADLPIVAKADAGWGASNVRIFRERRPLIQHVKRCFNEGLVTEIGGLRNVEWGSVTLQEYIPAEIEWRMVRLGKYFFGHQKLKAGEFHSGSKLIGWQIPPKRLLDFLYDVTQKGRFTSMSLDTFETPDGRYLVNEVQPLFGAHLPYQMKVDDVPGRYLRDDTTGEWRFEDGKFCQNAGWNLRVETLLASLGRVLPWRDPEPPDQTASRTGGHTAP